MFLRQKVPWTSQPQQPVTPRHNAAFMFNAATPEIEFVSRRNFVKTSSFAAAVGKYGRYISNSSPNTPALTIAGYSPIQTLDGAGLGDFTLCALAEIPASGSGTAFTIISQRDGIGAPYNQVQLTGNGYSSLHSSGYWGISSYANAWHEQRSSSNTYCGDGLTHTWIAVRRGSNFELYIDGAIIANGTTNGTGPKDIYVAGAQEFALLGLGEYSGGYGAQNTKLYGAVGYNYAINATEASNLTPDGFWAVVAEP